tara:strand:- start:122 stop:352 length:231 start_codon:yes stop_codon:yes gene_type:complete
MMKNIPFIIFVLTEVLMLSTVAWIFMNPKYEFLEQIALSLIAVVALNFSLLLIYLFISYVGEKRTQGKKLTNTEEN